VREPLLIEKTASCWTFILNRPDKRNALSAALVDALLQGLHDVRIAQIPCVVLRGNGSNLSAGFDFTGYADLSEGDLLLRFVRIEEVLQQIATLPALTVGIAHGRNFGAGVDLLATCKQRWCLPDTTFRMPGLLFGLVLGTRRFQRIVGTDEATRILTAAHTLDAQEAQRIGFVQDIVDTQTLPERLNEAVANAQLLDINTRTQLYRVLAEDTADRDLAALVRSAARMGLKQRIRRYLG